MGYAYGVSIADSSMSGNLNSVDFYVGGLIGEAYGSSILRSFTAGNVSSDDSTVGGLIGYSEDSTIDESYTTGDVIGTGSDYGGLIGYSVEDTITNSYSRSNVTNGGLVGGLLGYCDNSTILNSYSTGTATAVGGNFGGLVGFDGGGCGVTNTFWDTETSALNTTSGGGTGKTTAEMKSISTFTDTATIGLDVSWDFEDVWQIAETVNNGYPCLQWQNSNCSAAPIDDNDGISAEEENAAPNAGDANNDGTQDSEQPFVTSFVNSVTKSYTTIELNSVCTITSATTKAETENNVADSGFNYSAGFSSFSANCGTPGYTTVVKIYQHGTTGSFAVRKYNPTNNAYFTVSTATLTQQTIGSKTVTVATFSITDGGSLDVDGVANGVIVDPVGLGTLAVGVPNTGLGGSRR